MRDSWIPYLDQNAPRYTSYPSALAFSELVGPSDTARALGGIQQYEPISLYIHIPFCKQLCWYCGCNMKVESRSDRISRYIDDLIAELELIGKLLEGRGRLSQVHFGGGTPNILPGREIERTLEAVENFFGLTDFTPVAMEIDPRLCGNFQAAQLAKLGIHRFSIGVQDFDIEVQAHINRIQPFDLVAKCVHQLRDAGVEDISLDLLYGLPRQTVETFQRTVEQTISLNPDRVSLFGYAHMPSKLKHQRMIPTEVLPGRRDRTVIAELGADALTKAGYRRIGFDHFARPHTPLAQADVAGKLNRNFQGYTEDPASVVIGAGTSAITSVHGLLTQNTKNPLAYHDMISAGHLPVDRGTIASLEEEDLGDWIKRLLCDMRGNLSAYFDIVGADGPTCDDILARLQPMVSDGIVSLENDMIVISPDAAPLARLVAMQFDPYIADPKSAASPAV